MRNLISLLETGEPYPKSGDSFFDLRQLQRVYQQDDASRSILIHMSPDEFLEVAEHQPEMGSKTERIQAAIENGTPLADIPFLGFIHDGRGTAMVVMHDGRHRARVLKRLGVTSMPVEFRSIEGGSGKAIRWGKVNSDGYDRFDQIWPTTLVAEDGRGEIAFPVSRPVMLNETTIERAPTDTDTPEFRRWFGESKIFINYPDEPMPVIHRTHMEFSEFSHTWVMQTFPNRDPEGIDRIGFWFTDNPKVAYGPKDMRCYLRIERPYYYDDEAADVVAWVQLQRDINAHGGASAYRKHLITQGYDGIAMTKTFLDGHVQTVFIVFDPQQIKSIYNRGTWDVNDSDILR